MKKIAFVAIGLVGLALSGCASRYYDDGYYDRYGYRHGYSDRYYDNSYSYRDRYDRDRDNDGVPDYADRRPYNPYRD